MKQIIHATGSGDVLSVCMMLMYRFADIAIQEKLHFANRITADYIAGYRKLVPELLP